jgi:hypothetical protein
MSQHLVLLGDSIFDNGAYVAPGEPDVIRQVQTLLPAGWQATLRAVDGDCVPDIESQLRRLPADASHLALSIGGNDALGHINFLSEPARSVAEVLERLAVIGQAFQDSYRRMLAQVLGHGLPTIVCTIYEGNLDAQEQRIASTALKVFNDAILREAIAAEVPVVDLRLVCSRPEDYANPIEPSAIGGQKIAAHLVRVATEHNFSSPGCRIYGA